MRTGGVPFRWLSTPRPGEWTPGEGDTAMEHRSTTQAAESTVCWESLEAWSRQQIQVFIQAVLEEEVTAFLGRRKAERRQAVDAPPGYRNGYGKPRRLSLTSGTLTLRRPRLRNLEEWFESRILPLFQRRTREVGALLPTLYLHGLAQGDFELALRGLLGAGAPLSSSSLQRLRANWDAEYDAWRTRDLHDRELVYLWGPTDSTSRRAWRRRRRPSWSSSGPCETARRRSWPWTAGRGSPLRPGRASCVLCRLAACRVPGSPLPTATWASGAHWRRSIRRAPSSGAGTTSS